MRHARVCLAVLTLAVVPPVLVLAQPAIKREPARATTLIEGDALYNAYCAVCHGKDGKGGGPAAAALKVPVPDLTQMAAQNDGKFSAVDAQAAITGQGRPMVAAHGAQDMPIWGPIFRDLSSDPDVTRLRIANLVRHLESLQRK